MKRSKSCKQKAILSFDPSLTAWGWIVLTLQGVCLEGGCIKTEKLSKLLRIRKGDDDIRRIKEINKVLLDLYEKYDVRYILAELPHGSQSSSAANSFGTVKGIIQMFGDSKEIGVEWYSEGDAKRCLFGRQSATKAETIHAIDGLYTVPWTEKKYKDEAIADAMAIYHVASKQSETLKILKQL